MSSSIIPYVDDLCFTEKFTRAASALGVSERTARRWAAQLVGRGLLEVGRAKLPHGRGHAMALYSFPLVEAARLDPWAYETPEEDGGYSDESAARSNVSAPQSDESAARSNVSAPQSEYEIKGAAVSAARLNVSAPHSAAQSNVSAPQDRYIELYRVSSNEEYQVSVDRGNVISYKAPARRCPGCGADMVELTPGWLDCLSCGQLVEVCT